MRMKHLLLVGAVTVLGWPNMVSAQTWLVQRILDKADTPIVRLFDKSGKQVDSVNLDWLRRLDDVATRLVISYGMPMPELLLSKTNGPNAFVTVGKTGPVMVVMTDMLRIIGEDDGLMAAVVGHELGHLAANHPVQGGSDMSAIGNLGQLIGTALDAGQAQKGIDTQGAGRQLGAAGASLINAKYSRDQERVADDLGIKHMALAGFNPDDAPRLVQVMDRAMDGGNGLWNATHPSFPERYQALLKASKSLQETYRENRIRQPAKVSLPDTFKRDGIVASLMPDWRILRESALFGLWLRQEPDSTGDKLDSSRAEDVVAVLKSFQSELPTLADAAFARTDYAVAFEGYEYLASKGNADAQASLGSMYLMALGVPRDEAKAREWLSKASANGSVAATAALEKLTRRDVKLPPVKTTQTPTTSPLVESKPLNLKSPEARLVELKSLFEKGLISKPQYEQKREEILKSL